MPYLWAAYRKKALTMHPIFEEDMDKDEFLQAIASYLDANNLEAISFFAGEDLKAVGLGLLWVRGRVIQISDLIWYPWASKRQVIETFLNFINEIRSTTHPETGRKYMVLEFAREEDQAFFDYICKYGVMRRVGTSYEIYENQRARIYETVGVNGR